MVISSVYRRGPALPFTMLGTLALLPLLPRDWVGNWHDIGRAAQAPLFLLAVPFALSRVTATSFKTLCGSDIVCLVLVAASCWHAALPLVTLRELALWAGLALIAAATTSSLNHDAAWPRLSQGLVLAIGVYCASTLIVALMLLLTGVAPDNEHLIFGYDNPRFLNHAQTIFIPLLAGAACTQDLKRFWRGLACFALVVQFALLALTLGRATTLGLLAAAVVAVALFGTAGRQMTRTLAWSALAGLLLYLCTFVWLPLALGHGTQDTLHATASLAGDHSRLALWHIALADIIRSPWLGIGPMHFAHYPNGLGAHPHDLYLQVAAEFGLPAAGLIFFRAFQALWRRGTSLRANAQTKPLQLAALLSCVGAAVDALFSGNLVMPIAQLWFALALGILFAPAHQPAHAASVGQRKNWLLLSIALLCFTIFAASTWVGWWERRNAPVSATTQPQQTDYPRFWLNGWF